MTWFFAVLIVAVMGAVAVVASGRWGGLAETWDDRPDATTPGAGPVTAADLEAVRFTSALRGYRMSEVDALLDRLTAQLRETDQTDQTDQGHQGEQAARADRAARAGQTDQTDQADRADRAARDVGERPRDQHDER